MRPSVLTCRSRTLEQCEPFDVSIDVNGAIGAFFIDHRGGAHGHLVTGRVRLVVGRAHLPCRAFEYDPARCRYQEISQAGQRKTVVVQQIFDSQDHLNISIRKLPVVGARVSGGPDETAFFIFPDALLGQAYPLGYFIYQICSRIDFAAVHVVRNPKIVFYLKLLKAAAELTMKAFKSQIFGDPRKILNESNSIRRTAGGKGLFHSELLLCMSTVLPMRQSVSRCNKVYAFLPLSALLVFSPRPIP